MTRRHVHTSDTWGDNHLMPQVGQVLSEELAHAEVVDALCEYLRIRKDEPFIQRGIVVCMDKVTIEASPGVNFVVSEETVTRALKQFRQTRGGRSHSSHSNPQVTLGLGTAKAREVLLPRTKKRAVG